jgi:hypothetical protein
MDASERLGIGSVRGHIRTMRTRSLILLFVAVLAGVILLAWRNELHAHGPQHLNQLGAPLTECGFWGDMSAGMSCR